MTTAEADSATIFADAWSMREAALERMAAGDYRDAAEKAWCATLRATEALVLARSGDGPRTSTFAGRRLRAIARTEPALKELRDRYLVRQAILHGECFYHDYYDPEEIEELIHETADYIQDAESLAR